MKTAILIAIGLTAAGVMERRRIGPRQFEFWAIAGLLASTYAVGGMV